MIVFISNPQGLNALHTQNGIIRFGNWKKKIDKSHAILHQHSSDVTEES